MSDWVTVTGVRPYDGRYEIDIFEQPLTTREWGWIKKHAGYLPATLGEDWLGDPEFIAVLAVIALRRNDRIENREVAAVLDKFQDAPFGTAITIEVGERDEADEGDAGPPPSRTTSNGSSNGHGSTTTTENSESPPTPIGPLRSGISESDPAMSVS